MYPNRHLYCFLLLPEGCFLLPQGPPIPLRVELVGGFGEVPSLPPRKRQLKGRPGRFHQRLHECACGIDRTVPWYSLNRPVSNRYRTSHVYEGVAEKVAPVQAFLPLE